MTVKSPKNQENTKTFHYFAQALETSLAGALSLFLAGACQLPEPYWAAISAIVVMQSDPQAIMDDAWKRLVGTAIGALVGTGVIFLAGMTLWSFALAVMIASLACALFGRWETYRFAGVTVAIVMLVIHHGPPWVVGLHRFLEVSFGICVAYAIAFVAAKTFRRA